MQNLKETISGPLIIIEDDEDDQFILEKVFLDLGISSEDIIFFINPVEVLTYLQSEQPQPFLIISDINLPQYDGLELKRRIDQDAELKRKSIPFVFMSTSADKWVVEKAYTNLTVQGFFQKPHSYEAMKQLMKCILDYWKVCEHPTVLH